MMTLTGKTKYLWYVCVCLCFGPSGLARRLRLSADSKIMVSTTLYSRAKVYFAQGVQVLGSIVLGSLFFL
jgi:hypothetical protein